MLVHLGRLYLFAPRVVEPPRAGFENLLLVNFKGIGQTALEILQVIVRVMIGLMPQQGLDHGVVAGDEFNHQGRAETRQPRNELSERNMRTDNHMVEQGQT